MLFTPTGASVNDLNLVHSGLANIRFDGRGGGYDVGVAGGPTVVMDKSQHFTSLSITAGASAAMAGGSNALIVTHNMAFGGNGNLDLNDNDLIVFYDGSSVLSSLQASINSARTGGTWSGAGLNSTSARDINPRTTTLAAIEASQYKSIYGAGATFDGEALPTDAVLVKYTYYGETDFNGKVNFDDHARLDSGFNGNRSGWINGDFDGNGKINFDDYTVIDLAFNAQGPPL